jgi:hypothetical protein
MNVQEELQATVEVGAHSTPYRHVGLKRAARRGEYRRKTKRDPE